MSEQVKSITLRAGYESNIKDTLQQDIGTIKAFKRNLEKNPIKVPIRLDLSGIRSDAARAAAEYKKALAASLSSVKPGGGTVSKGGIIIPASAVGEMKEFAATGAGAFKEVRSENGKLIQSYEQLAAGIQRVTNVTKKGKAVKLVDTRPLDDFQRALADVERRFAGRIGAAKGTGGDVAGILREKQQAIVDVLKDPKLTSAVKDTPVYQKADRSLNRLEERIEAMTGTQNQRTAKQNRGLRIDALKERLLQINEATSTNLGTAQGTRGDVARVLADKRAAIDAELKNFADIQDSPAFRQARNAVTTLDKQIAAATPRQKEAADKKAIASRRTALKDRLALLDSWEDPAIGKARGEKGDVATALRKKQMSIARELASYADIADSPEFKRAQRSITSLEKEIAAALPRQDRAKKNDERKDYNQRAGNIIARMDDRLNRRLVKKSKGDEADARALPDRVAREAAVNRVLDDREAILRRQAQTYRNLEQAAKRAGQTQAEARFRNAANRAEGQLGQVKLERRRESAANRLANSETSLKRELATLQQTERVQREILKNEEAAAKKITDRAAREARINQILAQRQALSKRSEQSAADIANRAQTAGFSGLSDRATGVASNYRKQAVGDMRRLDAATTRSGHAFNFHTSSLLKNAATFTKWYVPAQAAMGAFAAIGSGMRQAVDAQRSFKILNAVFRGSAEDSALLADQTLALAAANGRGTDEAAQAAVAWARMGLTRNQILVAMESSLRAANVAEISAAEATAYLTANYKAFGQTIADIPATLDYINALSNKNAVAPKEIFEGLSRSAAIAKSAGIEFETLAGIITAVTQVTQRPGAETGNSIKTILTRLNRPLVTAELKEQFDLDFSTSDGNVRSMTEVLTELAALYPKLNSYEQARLKNIVAGAHQGNRFAIMMETWTDNLIAQAKAGVDANSAMRENASIMDSVSAKLESLNTSWTRLFHTMGEAGVFDVVTNLLAGVSDGVDDLSSKLSGLGSLVGLAPDTVSNFVNASTRRMGKSFGATPLFLYNTAKDAINGELLGKQDPADRTALATTRLGKMAQETTQSRNRVKSFAAGDQVFRILARQLQDGDVPTQKLLSQFDEAIPVLSELPGGQANVARARLKVRPLLEKEDRKAGAKALNWLAGELYVGKEDEFTSSEEKRQSAIRETEAVIAATTRTRENLDKELANTTGQKEQDALTIKIYETDQALKEQQNTLATLRQEFEKPLPDPLAEFKYKLDAYLGDLTLIAEAYGKLMETGGSTGFANLDAKMKLGAARLEGNLLEGDIASTRATNEATDSYGIEPELKAARDRALQMMESRLEEIREATAEAERKIELERQTATLQTAYEDSRQRTASGFSRYEVGQSDGARLAARTGGIIRELQADVANPNLGAGDPAQDWQELGAITERMSGAKEGIASMEDRINRALAERVNLESEIAEENRKQTEEASRRLALASREDQLRAAAFKAFQNSRGGAPISMDEFQFFSQETRNAVSNFSPGSVKGLDESEVTQAESRAKLDREIAGLAVSLKAMRESFAALLPDAEKKAGSIPDLNNPTGSGPIPASRIMAGDKNEVRMNLVTGPITVNLDFTRHVQSIKEALQSTFDARFKTMAESLRRTLGTTLDPDTSAAAGAW